MPHWLRQKLVANGGANLAAPWLLLAFAGLVVLLFPVGHEPLLECHPSERTRCDPRPYAPFTWVEQRKVQVAGPLP